MDPLLSSLTLLASFYEKLLLFVACKFMKIEEPKKGFVAFFLLLLLLCVHLPVTKLEPARRGNLK
jgi:hypothetical protein